MDGQQLATFQAVIAEGSFEAAARALHVTPSAVSQRIKALERDVGQVLVRRGKPAEPTEAGQALVRYAGQVALLEREALAAARGIVPAQGRTRLSVAVNADSLQTWFVGVLGAFPAELPVTFELHQDDQDHSADLLRSGTVMAAITGQRVAVQGCRVEGLGAMRYVSVAAPGRFRGFDETPMLVFNRKDRLQHRFAAGQAGREIDPPVHYVPANPAFVDAIRLGLGWGMVPESAARPDLATGALVEVAPGAHLDVPLFWQHWRLESAALTALTEAVRAAAARELR